MTDTAPKLSYSIAEAVKATGVSKNTIWRAIAAKELETFKWGARTLIPAESLEGLIQRRRSAA